MKTITIRNITIGEGLPKIIVPIVAKTKESIIDKARIFNNLKIDFVEWRVDFYEDVFNIENLLNTLKDLRATIPNIPILFTFRTKKEGGEKEISMSEYTALNKSAAQSGNADLIDVEIFSGDDVVNENITNIHEAGVLVVGSNHDFFKTPDKDDIVSRLRRMQHMGADIPKIAVMPQSTEDVLILLSATAEMHTKYADRPIITMSMGPLGVISRLSGEVFGSSMTFGAVGDISAPGQIPADELAATLEILHKSLCL
ncbi:MAG TPA: type I 3-dehydroquinate dehydratase [Clostridiales bacterium]|nr:type I 3-dehydroquinate dehydratase [Clostridiales bacterium]